MGLVLFSGIKKSPWADPRGLFMIHTKVGLVDYEVSEHGEIVSGESAHELISSRGRSRERYLALISGTDQYRVGDHP